MKVLFLSNTAGQGHHSTANAIMEKLMSLGVECKTLDTYAYINPMLYEGLAHGYLLSTSLTPAAYGQFYRMAELRTKNGSRHSLTNVTNSIMAVKLSKFFREFKPDVIVCTHLFSAQLVNVMKLKGQIDATAIGIVTDFTIHPFWQNLEALDYFVTASELLTYHAVQKGIPENKILPFGIPINPKFSVRVEKAEARRQLGVAEDKFTVLLMSGSMGHGNIAKSVRMMDALENDFQIIAVCGSNKIAKHRIDAMKTSKKVYSYAYVNNVELMMDASDCIITKPGGLTTSEALAKHLPILMINPIPGQEERNVEFMLNNGMAMNVTPTYGIDEALYQLFLYPEKLRNMESNIRLVGKPNATADLCDFIMKLETHDNP
ncbi:MAG: glycosyltransferase [Clostridia bacterium]|nr:glycosyltransferase [Clostridia bacterium]